MSTRYRIRPGYLAVRRDENRLQIGIDPPRRAIVPDGLEVRRLLTDLVAGRAVEPDHLPGRHTMQQLGNAGLLELADHLDPPPPITFDGPPALVSAARALAGFAPTEPAPAGRLPAGRLPTGRAAPAGPAAAAPPAAEQTGRRAPEIVLLLSAGPLDRERSDELMREGRPHLVVESGPDAWSVGPLVVPGVTACLRCVDAALAEEDERRAVIVQQLLGVEVPHDALLQSLALSWAVRDARAHLTGRTPVSWSTSVTLTRDEEPTTRKWLRHPYCGCAWDLIASGSVRPGRPA